MVIVRLARSGSKKRAFYHFTVADSRLALKKRYIERLGFFNPGAKNEEERMHIDCERLVHWRGLGAQLSHSVERLLKKSKLQY